MWLRHNGITRELITGATASDALFQNTVADMAVPFPVLVHAALAATFYVSGTATAIEAAFAQQSLVHNYFLINKW